MNTTDYDEPARGFGERVSAARAEAGLSQAAVGDSLGVGGQAVSNWERGVNDPGALDIMPRPSRGFVCLPSKVFLDSLKSIFKMGPVPSGTPGALRRER